MMGSSLKAAMPATREMARTCRNEISMGIASIHGTELRIE
jgi:hypothetical protein